MKFDVVVGNPPYGKNANLAVEFVNVASHLTNYIVMVLPKTFRKPSILNRIDNNLHLIYDIDVNDDCFPGTISACYQIWKKLDNARDKIETFTTHADFDFVNKIDADISIGRVGAGPCGKVFLGNFEQRSSNSHYFLKVKSDDVIKRLQSLSEKFREAGNQTVGCPSLSKNDIIIWIHKLIPPCLDLNN